MLWRFHYGPHCPISPPNETCCLPRCVIRTVLLDLLDHAIEIGIAGAKAPCEPVSAALGNPLAVGYHLELTCFTRRSYGFNAEALLDERHETRDLGFVVLSRRAVNDLDLHSVLIRLLLDEAAWTSRFAERGGL